MKNTMKKSLSAALGTTFIAAMAASPVVNADTNPFGMQNIEGGYMQVADGKCGEGKMEMKKEKAKEAKCGESHKKEMEGKCGGEKKKEMKKMKKEGKCGEGKCGGKM